MFQFDFRIIIQQLIVTFEMTSPTDVLSDLIGIDFIRLKDGVPLREGISDATLEKLKTLEVGNDNVMVAGYPKTGNHFLLQILQELGYKRMYGETDGQGFIYIEIKIRCTDCTITYIGMTDYLYR